MYPLYSQLNDSRKRLYSFLSYNIGILPTAIWCKSCIYPKKWFEITKNSNIGSAGDFNAILTALFMEGTQAWQQLWGDEKKQAILVADEFYASVMQASA